MNRKGGKHTIFCLRRSAPAQLPPSFRVEQHRG